MDANALLHWVHESGVHGVEVALIPTSGRVFFFDESGPVHRDDDISEARWWCFVRPGTDQILRVTRLRVNDSYTYIIPWTAGPEVVNAPDIMCGEPGQCPEVANKAIEFMKRLTS